MFKITLENTYKQKETSVNLFDLVLIEETNKKELLQENLSQIRVTHFLEVLQIHVAHSYVVQYFLQENHKRIMNH